MYERSIASASGVCQFQIRFFAKQREELRMVNTLKPRWALPQSVQREMDQVFDHFFGGVNGGNGETLRPAFAPASLWEEEGRWCVEVDLPGVKQEDIDITVDEEHAAALSRTARSARGPQVLAPGTRLRQD
jgi:HSP20 family molecular chaperone IbpA